ncbi:TadE family protein [Microbacterium stercoris]|uniref:Pilus assembly protein n=1 Tax=Microbacterium stercoris TaxID=2820289 RepID=A0A939QKD6_9MICO|nr:TadE family protein [Microbacterium stercoris]MBO3663755.1 pilus assembly protein [Microbacterium stercoris]
MSVRGGERGPTAGERGSVAAELAVALPAVLLVLILGVGALFAASTQVRLQDVAADGARLVARGEPEARASAVVAQLDGARTAVSWRGDLVCVTAHATARVAGVGVPLSAVSCALGGGL